VTAQTARRARHLISQSIAVRLPAMKTGATVIIIGCIIIR